MMIIIGTILHVSPYIHQPEAMKKCVKTIGYVFFPGGSWCVFFLGGNFKGGSSDHPLHPPGSPQNVVSRGAFVWHLIRWCRQCLAKAVILGERFGA